MGTRYYHKSKYGSTSNGTVTELLIMFGKLCAFLVILAFRLCAFLVTLTLALLVLAAAGLAFAVTAGKWSGAQSVCHAGNMLARRAFGLRGDKRTYAEVRIGSGV